MYLFHLFRSFLPLHNPIGFGASDFIEFSLAALLVFLVLAGACVEPFARRLADKTIWCMLLLPALVISLRLALLPVHPVPTPAGADDFSYLLLSDTLAHFRLANPTHPMHRFFETTFVLQEPTYSSIYPLGQALVLAFGQLVFGLPWAGVVLSVAAFSSLCFWMLRGWTTPGWALVGGLLAVCEFGPLSHWMNCYWGGAVSAIAGCLVFGALPRLRERWRARDAVLLGLGLGIQMISRPYESIFLDLSVLLFFLPALRRRSEWPNLARASAIALLAVLPAVALVLVQDRSVTRSWTTIPYALSRYQYGVPAAFTFQPNLIPHFRLTPVQQLYFEGQAAVHGQGADTLASYLARVKSRMGVSRFFLLAPLCLVLPGFLPLLRNFRFAWLALTLLLFVLGSGLYPYFFPHYVAALASLFVLVSVLALERLSRLTIRGYDVGCQASRWVLFFCGAHFLFWYGLHALGNEQILRVMMPFETADAINYGDPEGRIAISRRLAQTPGQHLVFVRYWPTHEYHEWIHNAAEIDNAPVVRALDLGPSENEKLIQYYPGRTVWLLEPDARPPRLRPYTSVGNP
jgi:hypothetical protein